MPFNQYSYDPMASPFGAPVTTGRVPVSPRNQPVDPRAMYQEWAGSAFAAARPAAGAYGQPGNPAAAANMQARNAGGGAYTQTPPGARFAQNAMQRAPQPGAFLQQRPTQLQQARPTPPGPGGPFVQRAPLHGALPWGQTPQSKQTQMGNAYARAPQPFDGNPAAAFAEQAAQRQRRDDMMRAAAGAALGGGFYG